MLARDLTITTLDGLSRALAQKWKASSNEIIRKLQPARAPRLQTIFDPGFWSRARQAGEPQIDFDGMTGCGIRQMKEDLNADQKAAVVALESLDRMASPETRPEKWERVLPLKFAKRLWMTIRWSDQVAATTVLKDSGLDYVDGVMVLSGLRKADGRGLCARLTFGNPPKAASAIAAWPPELKDKLKLYDPEQLAAMTFDKKQLARQGGTARAVVNLFVALVRGTEGRTDKVAISPADSQEMAGLLRMLTSVTVHSFPVSVHGLPITDPLTGQPKTVRDLGTGSYIMDHLGPRSDRYRANVVHG